MFIEPLYADQDRRIVSFDLDSTLCDTRHRRQYLPSAENDYTWDTYASHCGEDRLIIAPALVWRAFEKQGYTIWVVSQRPLSSSYTTGEWLRRHKLHPFGVAMAMNDEEASMDPTEFKVLALTELQQQGVVILHVDDRPSVRPRLRSIGVECLIVTPPDE